MIRCRLSHLEARCRERGYTLDEVRACIISQDGKTLCVDEMHASYPHTKKPGLGDYIAACLEWLGITKPRVEALVGGPCGCPERQAALNQIGHKYLGLPTGTRG